MDRRDDTAIFGAFQRGEAAADKYIFQLYFRSLCYFAEKLSYHTPGETEDIVAETFVKMYQRRAEFANLANVKSFLYLATRNACINRFRDVRRRVDANRELALLTNEESVDNALDYEMIRARVLQEIYIEIEELPDRCREIFRMIFLQGLSTEQIAAQLGISPQTVRTQKARALQLLKTQLLKKGIPSFALLLFLHLQGR